jgi:hypothetical protein
VEFIISGLGPLLFSVLSWLAFLFTMAALQEALKAIEAAQLSKRNTWIAMRALFAHGDSCTDEVGERLEFVRPALQALVAGKQPTGSQRRRRNIALHSTLDGHRLGCRGDSSDASGSGGTVPSTSAQLFDIFDSECSTQEAGCQTDATFAPEQVIWFGYYQPPVAEAEPLLEVLRSECSTLGDVHPEVPQLAFASVASSLSAVSGGSGGGGGGDRRWRRWLRGSAGRARLFGGLAWWGGGLGGR